MRFWCSTRSRIKSMDWSRACVEGMRRTSCSCSTRNEAKSCNIRKVQNQNFSVRLQIRACFAIKISREQQREMHLRIAVGIEQGKFYIDRARRHWLNFILVRPRRTEFEILRMGREYAQTCEMSELTVNTHVTSARQPEPRPHFQIAPLPSRAGCRATSPNNAQST